MTTTMSRQGGGVIMTTTTLNTSGQCGSILPSAPTMKDLESLLLEIGNNPAFGRAQARGTIMEREYLTRASLACGGSLSQGQALIELLQDSLFRLTLNGAYSPSGTFTPWSVLALQYT